MSNTFSVHSVLSGYVQGPVWEGYPESLDENVFIYCFFYVKLNIVFDQKIVTLNAFKCHIKQIKKKIPEMSLSKSLKAKKNVNSLRFQ